MGRLHGHSTYLCGPIDRCPDGGKTWRQQAKAALSAMGVVVNDPLDKPYESGLEADDNRAERAGWKGRGDYDRFSGVMREVRAIDLHMVDESKSLIVHLNMDIPMCGTWEEAFWANRLKRPILVFCPQGKQAIPDWCFGTFPHRYFFGSLDEVLQLYRDIDSGRYDPKDRRWVFRRQPEAAVG